MMISSYLPWINPVIIPYNFIPLLFVLSVSMVR